MKQSRFNQTDHHLDNVDRTIGENPPSIDKETILLIAEAFAREGKKEEMSYLSVINIIVKEVQRIDKENPTGPDEETDPRIVKLLDLGTKLMLEIDPMVRENARNNPKALAEWDDIMQGIYEENKSDA